MFYIFRLLHSLHQAFSKVVYLVHAGCPAVLSQSHRSRQLAVKAYADGATECAASVAGAVQSICVARGAIPSTQLQVSLLAFSQCHILRTSLVLLAAYVDWLQCLCLHAICMWLCSLCVCICLQTECAHQWPRSRQYCPDRASIARV